MALFKDVDAIIAPSTRRCHRARPSASKTFTLDGVHIAGTTPDLGIYTQPISFIGLPVVAVPVLAQELLP